MCRQVFANNGVEVGVIYRRCFGAPVFYTCSNRFLFLPFVDCVQMHTRYHFSECAACSVGWLHRYSETGYIYIFGKYETV